MSESEPREFWIDTSTESTARNVYREQPISSSYIHVIEYSAYEAVVEGRNLENAMSDYVLKAERARNAKMIESLNTLRRYHNGDGSVTRDDVDKALAENNDILKERGR